ncbi:MAG: hypothetical protein LBE56_11375, partial [Tannerella sp.]|nr:hypothetical protein [Tannerella sp.]
MATLREKLATNIDAIEIALKLGREKATPDEIQALRQFSGFGDLKCILLDPSNPEEFARSEKHLIPLVQRLHDVIQDNAPKNYYKYFGSLATSVL